MYTYHMSISEGGNIATTFQMTVSVGSNIVQQFVMSTPSYCAVPA